MEKRNTIANFAKPQHTVDGKSKKTVGKMVYKHPMIIPLFDSPMMIPFFDKSHENPMGLSMGLSIIYGVFHRFTHYSWGVSPISPHSYHQ